MTSCPSKASIFSIWTALTLPFDSFKQYESELGVRRIQFRWMNQTKEMFAKFWLIWARIVQMNKHHQLLIKFGRKETGGGNTDLLAIS